MKLTDIQKEAEHTYNVYLGWTGVMGDPNSKLPLLKWVDACSTAIDCIGKADPNKILLLAEELEICAVKPLEAMLSAITVTYNTKTGKSYPRICFSRGNVVEKKKSIIREINRLLIKLNEETGSHYKEIEYDPSND